MKFARYLQETAAPEWKKAYIDYKGLKQRIRAIQNAQQRLVVHRSPAESAGRRLSQLLALRPSPGNFGHDERAANPNPGDNLASALEADRIDGEASALSILELPRTKPTDTPRSSRRFRDSLLPLFKGLSHANSSDGAPPSTDALAALPLQELLTRLTPDEVSFFTMLDDQLQKVESFYVSREKEMLDRGDLLQLQLNELEDHRRSIFGTHPTPPGTGKGTWAPTRKPKQKTDSTDAERVVSINPSTSALSRSSTLRSCREEYLVHKSWSKYSRVTEPDTYLSARRKLKKAVLEYYRLDISFARGPVLMSSFYSGLEVLHNYHVLNVTGFQKALKKLKKYTKIPAQKQYMTEKVEKSSFASHAAIKSMIARMEEMYADAFTRGDRKRALERLRSGTMNKSHHFSTLRSGWFLGLAIPPLVDGLVKVFQPETQRAIPIWATLLYLYGIVFVPVVFSVLVSLNLLVWAHARINYVFIFELDVLTRLDHRKYLEIPSILFSTLCCAFWLSYARLSIFHVEPSWWLLIWLGFATVVICDPLPIFFRSSRFWLVKSVGRLFLSGSRSVEFRDFWLGDQFCSLSFTISNLPLFVSVYVTGFSIDCAEYASSAHHWPIVFVTASLPLLIRLIQSIKRYVDSRMPTHLLNGGKYFSGIVSYLFYYLWRFHQDEPGMWFVLWCVFNTLYSVYAGAWDLWMDWSLLRLNSKNYLLRDELGYANHVYMYYFAMISNTLIRFTWVIYIPQSGFSSMDRAFIIGALEILRRWQWNFYRLENEHIGNVDQYRVTREVPLPYSFDRIRGEDGDDNDNGGGRPQE